VKHATAGNDCGLSLFVDRYGVCRYAAYNFGMSQSFVTTTKQVNAALSYDLLQQQNMAPRSIHQRN
jgi:hypothetical protein